MNRREKLRIMVRLFEIQETVPEREQKPLILPVEAAFDELNVLTARTPRQPAPAPCGRTGPSVGF